jgi:hypothetical protein
MKASGDDELATLGLLLDPGFDSRKRLENGDTTDIASHNIYYRNTRIRAENPIR